MRSARMLRGLRVIVASSAALVAGVAAIDFGVHRAAANSPLSYTLTASADEASSELDAANFPVLAPQVAYSSPGIAQAALDSIGGSTAFAGSPFFGQTVEGAGGLASGVGQGSGIPPLPPTLPGYVSTVSPSDPSESESQGPYTLTANSTAHSSTATAGIAAVSGRSQFLATSATATTALKPDGSLLATAKAITQPFAFENLIHIGAVQASATITVDPNGKLTKTSDLLVGSMTVAGLKIGVTPSGLQVLNSTLPITSTDNLNSLLEPAGLEMKLLPARETATTVTSAGLQIAEKLTVPVEGASGVFVTLGHATASLQYQTAPPANSGAATGITGSTSARAPADAAPSFNPANSPNPSTANPGPSPTTGSSGVSIASPVAPPTISTDGGTAATASRLSLGPDIIRWYTVLVVAAFALTAASRLAGAIAIRPRRRT